MKEALKYLAGGVLGALLGMGGMYLALDAASDEAVAKSAVGTEPGGSGEEAQDADASAATDPEEGSARETGGEDAPEEAGGETPSPEDAKRIEALAKENERLLQEVESLRERMETDQAPPKRSPGIYRFGLGEDTPAFDKADWKNLSKHMMALSEALPGFLEARLKGEQPSEEDIKMVTKNNAPLAQFAMSVQEEVEGANANGSFTHPAVMANLIRMALVDTELPLTENQEISLRALGEAWSAEWERTKQGFTENTLPLRKTVEEVDAKLRFLYGAKNILTPAQKDLLFDPETEGRRQIDLLSPALVYIFWQPVGARTRQALEENLLKTLFQTAGLSGADRSASAWVVSRWVDEIPFCLEAVADHSLDFICPRVDQIQAGARAQLRAMERIASSGQLTPEEAESLRKVTLVLSPRLLKG